MISKFISIKSWLFTLEIFCKRNKININFDINLQCERGLRVFYRQAAVNAVDDEDSVDAVCC